jgi:pilus assembly protein CpaE
MTDLQASQKGQGLPSKTAADVRVFVCDHDSAGVVRQSLSDLGIADANISVGNVGREARVLSTEKSPRLLIVDVSGFEDPGVSLLELADVCEPHIQVIAIGNRNDIILYRDLKNVGVAEYLLKPLVRDMMTETINAILKPITVHERARQGKLVFMLGIRGGCGASTLAAHTAWNLAEIRRRRTLLLDLDLQNGDAALQLDFAPSHALFEALEYPERVDKLYLDRAVKHVTERLDLLASLEPLGSAAGIGEDSVLSLLDKLLRRYRYLIADLPAEAAVRLKNVLHLPSICILVSNASLSSARDVARWREHVGPSTSERTILHVMNQTTRGGLSAAEFAKAAGAAPDVVIPYDRELAQAATLGMKAMRDCPVFNRGLAPILSNITGTPVEESRSLFTRLFS